MHHIQRIGKENCIKLAKEKMSREILKPRKKKKKKKKKTPKKKKKKKKKKLAGMLYRNLSCHI